MSRRVALELVTSVLVKFHTLVKGCMEGLDEHCRKKIRASYFKEKSLESSIIKPSFVRESVPSCVVRRTKVLLRVILWANGKQKVLMANKTAERHSKRKWDLAHRASHL